MDFEKLLAMGKELSVSDFKDVYPGVPMTSLYAHIRTLQKAGQLVTVGKGRYMSIPKPRYTQGVTPWMLEVSAFLTSNLEGVHHCVYQKGDNLIVETDKSDLAKVRECLLSKYRKVAMKKDTEHLDVPLNGFILIGRLISEAPIFEEGGCWIPSLEKELVDRISVNGIRGNVNPLQRSMEVFPVNKNRLIRYAARRGVSEELAFFLSNLNQSRIEMFGKIQTYLAKTAIEKAWVFGSFARGEETPESDLDLLVSYDTRSQLSLLTIIRYRLDLEKLTGREVDIVEEGYLKPFAISSANRDKYLIYAR